MIVRLFCCLFGFGPDAKIRTPSGIRSEVACVGHLERKRLEPFGDSVNNPASEDSEETRFPLKPQEETPGKLEGGTNRGAAGG